MSNWMRHLFSAPSRTTIGILATTAACGVFSVSYFPQSILLYKYHDFVTFRKYDEPVPVSPALEKLWTEVSNDLNLNQYQQRLVKPFTVCGFDVWHAGSLKTKSGAIIGIPINFTYKDVDSIDKRTIILKNESVQWDDEYAKKFLSSLVLSDNAKKYALAREILITDNYNIFVQALINGTLAGSVYGSCAHLNDHYKMFEKPRIYRLAMYLGVSILFFGFWISQRDALSRSFEADVDERLSQLGINYVQGGVEYHSKKLERNISMKYLLGEEAEGIFTPAGNEYYLIRMKNLPITNRKNYFLEKLRELKASMKNDMEFSVSSD